MWSKLQTCFIDYVCDNELTPIVVDWNHKLCMWFKLQACFTNCVCGNINMINVNDLSAPLWKDMLLVDV